MLEMPFLYDTLDQVKSVVDKISPQLEARMASVGLALLGYLYDGPRVTLSTQPLNSMDDFKGLKLRVPQIPLYVQMAQAFGATPTPVALPEVYTALQSRIVEGLEGTPTSLYTQKYHEVAKNLARTDHIFFVAYIAMNGPLLAKLSPDKQEAIRAAGREASAYNLEIAKPAVQEDFARLAAGGRQDHHARSGALPRRGRSHAGEVRGRPGGAWPRDLQRGQGRDQGLTGPRRGRSRRATGAAPLV